mmetsp:Transcript_4493/g.16127  ORF Transcript_4493/g.16127 Transcript_4493/m.16127 type:complete len:543 (-) Transcript_4493:272-1900(-)
MSQRVFNEAEPPPLVSNQQAPPLPVEAEPPKSQSAEGVHTPETHKACEAPPRMDPDDEEYEKKIRGEQRRLEAARMAQEAARLEVETAKLSLEKAKYEEEAKAIQTDLEKLKMALERAHARAALEAEQKNDFPELPGEELERDMIMQEQSSGEEKKAIFPSIGSSSAPRARPAKKVDYEELLSMALEEEKRTGRMDKINDLFFAEEKGFTNVENMDAEQYSRYREYLESQEEIKRSLKYAVDKFGVEGAARRLSAMCGTSPGLDWPPLDKSGSKRGRAARTGGRVATTAATLGVLGIVGFSAVCVVRKLLGHRQFEFLENIKRKLLQLKERAKNLSKRITSGSEQSPGNRDRNKASLRRSASKDPLMSKSPSMPALTPSGGVKTSNSHSNLLNHGAQPNKSVAAAHKENRLPKPRAPANGHKDDDDVQDDTASKTFNPTSNSVQRGDKSLGGQSGMSADRPPPPRWTQMNEKAARVPKGNSKTDLGIGGVGVRIGNSYLREVGKATCVVEVGVYQTASCCCRMARGIGRKLLLLQRMVEREG